MPPTVSPELGILTNDSREVLGNGRLANSETSRDVHLRLIGAEDTNRDLTLTLGKLKRSQLGTHYPLDRI
jgi:hypothetical protein